MGICIKRRDNMQVAALGNTCSPSDICSNGAECINSRCQCPQGRQERAGFCIIFARPAESCLNGEFCVENAVCNTNVGACVCPMGMRATEDGCVNEQVEGAKTENTSNSRLEEEK